MIPFVAMVAISFGLNLSMDIISFIVDEKSKEEEKKLEELKKEYDRKQEFANQKRAEVIKELSKRYSSEMKEEYLKELNEQKYILKCEAKEATLSLIKIKLLERIGYVNEKLLPDIESALNILKKQKVNYNSSLRYNSFRMLREELEEAKNKAKAYQNYLKRYEKLLSDIYDKCDKAEDVLFSYNLPKEFPYQNKIFFLKSNDFDKKSGMGSTILHGCLKIDFYITDYDFYKNDCSDCVIVMMLNFDNKNFRNNYSIQHGQYKQIKKSGGFTGITAKVYGFSNQNIKLQYGKDMELNLPSKNLYNFNRFPAIGSEIIVYPIDEYYSSKENKMIYNVSQRQEDTEISLNFHKLPLILPKNKLNEFIQYWEDNKINLNITYDDVKVAPISKIDSDILNPQKLFIQFGDYFTMLVEIKSSAQKQYLWFEKFVDMKHLSAEDIFIPFNSEIDILSEIDFDAYIDNSDNNEAFENMNNLILTIFKEFNLQHKLKESQDGMRYFSAWENITSALKKFVEKSNPLDIEIIEIPEHINIKNKGDILKNKVKSPDVLCKYYEKILKEQDNTHIIPEFFIEYQKAYYSIEISPNCEFIKILIPDSASLNKDEKSNIIEGISLLSTITIYMKNYGIPEQRQLQALHNFKIGKMQNSILQLYMLNGNHILSYTRNYELHELFNKNLSSNESQYCSLLKCLEEKNLFFIQGPPGTGKTTVIRELIAQTILENPDSRILIVSQANVAVDNVVKGLVKGNMPFTIEDIIRCGRTGKISSDILDMSYETKYNAYIDSIKDIKNKTDNSTIRQLATTWLSKITKKSGYNPDVGELIIRNHKIIGATCVGLLQKRIGIDKITFDLVIIDEAGKALAPEIVIPMIQAKKAIIIGDHKQLPAVMNPALYDEEKIELDERKYCKKEIFDISYFQKLYESCPDSNKSSLDTQYRMPSIIGTLISKIFYDGKLKNGVGTELKKPIYGENPLTIIDMSNEINYKEDETSSPINKYEAKYVIYLLKDILNKNIDAKIAVITPYKGQKKQIKRLLINSNISHNNNIHIDTVDSFQGDEADIVIYCTTRSKKKTKFLSDRRRINVAVSRTRNEFIMIASVKYLESYSNNEPIRQVYEYIKENGIIKKPIKLKESHEDMNIDIIHINDIVANDYDSFSNEDVAREIDYYNNYGCFSIVPIVRKANNIFIIDNHIEIYFAALQLSITEIPVKLSYTNENDNILYNNKISIDKKILNT